MKFSCKAILRGFLLAATLAACAAKPLGPKLAPEPAAASQENPLNAPIQNGIEALQHLLLPDGKFVYLFDSKDKRPPSKSYNVIRHAGAIYSLGMFTERSPNEETKGALRRSSSFLLENTVRTVKIGGQARLAIVTDPKLVTSKNEIVASLGGTGLGLVGLLKMEAALPGSLDRKTLQGLGGFLVSMQKKDGSFYSQFYPERPHGKSDEFSSLYYPGEAILALAMLHHYDKDTAWLKAALKGIRFLADSRRGSRKVPADNWALIASAELMRLPLEGGDRKLILAHARQIIAEDLRFQVLDSTNPTHGCYTRDGRTTPTSTRLEGLLAAMEFLPPEDEKIRAEISKSTPLAIRFLLRTQLEVGAHKGAIPAAMELAEPDERVKKTRRPADVRIDFIQHAMSAMMRFQKLGLKL